MQRGLRVITLQGAIQKSPILISQYSKNEWLDDGTTIISYFGGSNNIFADYIYWWKGANVTIDKYENKAQLYPAKSRYC